MQNRAVRCAAIMHLWQRYKITYMPIVAIVATMAQDEIRGFEETLEDWAASNPCLGEIAYHWPASRWRSEICYRLLKAGEDAPGGVEEWFKARAKEVREIADGVRT